MGTQLRVLVIFFPTRVRRSSHDQWTFPTFMFDLMVSHGECLDLCTPKRKAYVALKKPRTSKMEAHELARLSAESIRGKEILLAP